MRDTVLLSTMNSAYFAELIAKMLDLTLTSTKRKIFGGGEKYFCIGLDNRADLFGKNVVIVGSTHTDDDLLELIRVGSAAAKYGSEQRIFVIPFLGYSTMERASLPGEVVTAKTVTRMLSDIPNTRRGNAFLMLDLHVSGLVHYFEGDSLPYEEYAESALLLAITQLGLENFMFASADLGRPQWVKIYAKHFGTRIAMVDKDRDFEETNVLYVIGDVRGKNVLIYDDMVRSAGSLIKAAEAYLREGALSVYAVTSHLALNDATVVDRINRSPIVKVISTNSHPMSQDPAVRASDKFIITDVAPVFKDRLLTALSA